MNNSQYLHYMRFNVRITVITPSFNKQLAKNFALDGFAVIDKSPLKFG